MSSIWNSALNILARREHSQAELLTKLTRKYPEQESEIQGVLQRLVDNGLQSDERYSEMWLRSQIAKGRGPIRIRLEARQKGVEALISSLIDSTEHDWFEAASDIARRKFPQGITFELKGKAYRFLSYRGFNNDMIQYAVNANSQEN
jgi:regulatory protein